MSDSNSKKDQKKQDKKEIEAFKKAFKKQTGVASDSKDWGKLVDAFGTQVKELTKWSAILVKLQPEERDPAAERIKYWADQGQSLRTDVKDKKKAETAGKQAREQLPILLKVIEAVRKKAKNKPAKVTVGEEEVAVYITDIPGYAEMKTDEREKALQVAAQKTKKGLELYDQLAKGEIDPDTSGPTSQDDAEALIWGLKSKAQQKFGGAYQKGAMTVPNGENLRKFLDKCPEAYSRLSSHLREQQGRNVKGGVKPKSLEGQTPRGMDFYNAQGDDKPGRLPSGMNALLFQQVELPGGEKALYIKMETEGSYGHPGDNRKMDSTVPPDRAKHPNDGARARKHLKNLVIKEKSKEDKDLPGLREQTPKEVVEAAKAVVAAVEGKNAKAYMKSSFGTEPKWLLFKKAVPRINTFLDAWDKIGEKHAGEKGWELGHAAEDLMDKLIQTLQAAFPEDQLEPDRRQGGEVVLTEEDMEKNGEEDEDLTDSDFDSFDSEEEDEDEVDTASLAVWCSDLLDAVTDPELKERLGKIYYGEVITSQSPEAFRRFDSVVGKSTEEDLGPRASKMYDRLSPMIERL